LLYDVDISVMWLRDNAWNAISFYLRNTFSFFFFFSLLEQKKANLWTVRAVDT
jgi:hypothetical protein